ncbi:hypothetical protein AB0E01_40235 [Nocardia vinacea]|uniref:hypothetical protein n=1 Tax=Nocardia vinacea TaxID=96468 RepID=UPI0033C2A492
MAITDVDTDLVRTTANNTFVGMGELETHLKTMAGAQDELLYALKGNTGDAVYNTMREAIEKGQKLARDLQGIIDVMQKNGISFDEDDLTQSQMVMAQMGADHINEGDQISPWGTDSAIKGLNLDFNQPQPASLPTTGN